jgi:hypothetical protein
MTSDAHSTVQDHLGGVVDMLAADGYLLDVTDVTADQISVAIRAGEDACADCLVGADLMKIFIVAELEESGSYPTVPSIDLKMP